MVKWTKKHPFGAFLLNAAITFLTVAIVSMFFVKTYGDKIDTVYKNSVIIKDAIIKIKCKSDG